MSLTCKARAGSVMTGKAVCTRHIQLAEGEGSSNVGKDAWGAAGREKACVRAGQGPS